MALNVFIHLVCGGSSHDSEGNNVVNIGVFHLFSVFNLF